MERGLGRQEALPPRRVIRQLDDLLFSLFTQVQDVARRAERYPPIIFAVAAFLNQRVVTFELEVVAGPRGTIEEQASGLRYVAFGHGANLPGARRHAGQKAALCVSPGALDLFSAHPAFSH